MSKQYKGNSVSGGRSPLGGKAGKGGKHGGGAGTNGGPGNADRGGAAQDRAPGRRGDGRKPTQPPRPDDG